jgi:hypothetical protein
LGRGILVEYLGVGQSRVFGLSLGSWIMDEFEEVGQFEIQKE